MMSTLTWKQAVLECIRRYAQEGLIDQNYEIHKASAKKFHEKYLQRKFQIYFHMVILNLLNFNIIKSPKQTGKPDKLIFKPGKLDLILERKDSYVRKGQNKVVVSQNVAFRSTKQTSPLTCTYCNKTFGTAAALAQHNTDKGHVIAKFERLAAKVESSPETKDVVAEIVQGMGNASETVFNDNTSFTVHLSIINKCNNLISLGDIRCIDAALSRFVNYAFTPGVVIEPCATLKIPLNLKFNARRAYKMPFTILYIDNNGRSEGFNKQLIFEIIAPEFASLKPTSPYQRAKPIATDMDETIVPGERLTFQSDFQALHPLKRYSLPPEFIHAFNSGLKLDWKTVKSQPLLEVKKLLEQDPKNCLTENTYHKMLDLLLYLEEHQMQIDIRHYDTNTNKLKLIRGNLYELEVPELSENRPSLIIGDSVFVKEIGAKIKYEGIVQEKFLDRVRLGFHPKFNSIYIAKKQFSVSFSFNRTTLKLEHQAAALAAKCAKYFFPKELPPSVGSELPGLNCYNRNISANPEQLRAVQEIVKGSVSNVPYLIFGPPGTGKTMTMVEAILQVRKANPNASILVSAPSNSAANLLCSRLAEYKLSTTEMLRYVSYTYSIFEIPANMLKYCNVLNGAVLHPTLKSILKYRVVITTLTNAGRLYNCGVPRNHFSFVFIDEAGHATETETLIPITAALVDNAMVKGRVILAGDPEQLGPIIHSSKAKEYGFGTSMLERLMRTSPIYEKNDGYDNRVLTKLVKNYRSHPHIIALSNTEFYHGELICEKEGIAYSGLGHEILPNKEYPMVFHGVLGADLREANSPSFFNIQEVKVVADYVKKLIGSKMKGYTVQAKDIAVITPYRKQVQKLRQFFKQDRRCDHLEIGTIEKLQGQERLIVIISTVRSKLESVQHDVKFHLGFLKNPKRMNVALTRAKALLLVVGNPNLLKYDKYWQKYMEQCLINKAVLGVSFTLHSDDELLNSFEKITINDQDDINFGRGNQ